MEIYEKIYFPLQHIFRRVITMQRSSMHFDIY